MATCIHLTWHVCVNMDVCLPQHRVTETVCVCFLQDRLCSWSFKCECLYVKRWTAARPHYCHSPHCLKERQREAKRPLSIQEPKERWRQKAQIKQMLESGLESQPMVMRFE